MITLENYSTLRKTSPIRICLTKSQMTWSGIEFCGWKSRTIVKVKNIGYIYILLLLLSVYNVRRERTSTHLKVSLDTRRTTRTTGCVGVGFLREISVKRGQYPWKRLPTKAQSWSLAAGVCSKLMTWDQLEHGFTEKFHLNCLTSNPNFCCVFRKKFPLPYIGRKTNTTCICVLLLYSIELIIFYFILFYIFYVCC